MTTEHRDATPSAEVRAIGARGNPLVGYYDRADQPVDQPTYDPPHEGPCVVCYKPLTAETVRTISVMAMPDTHPTRSYFYRLHRACHDSLTPEEQGALDHGVLDKEAHR